MATLKDKFFRRISVRLAFWYGLTLMLLLGLFSAFSFTFFRAGHVRDFDRHLQHEKMQLLPFIELTEAGPIFRGLDELRSVAYQTDGAFGTYVRLLSREGRVVYQSPNMEGHDLDARLPNGHEEQSVRHSWHGDPARTLYTPLRDNSAEVMGWLEVTGYEWALQQELRRLSRVMIVGILLSTMLAVVGGYLLARRALRPVAAMSEVADRIRATDLGARIPTRFGVRDELTELAETFNRMIDRLESSFSRERRFTDNAAHELMTPLATISSEVQIALRRPRDSDAYRSTLEAVQTDVEEMTETVRGMLQLSRMDRVQDLPRERVDLSGIIQAFLDRYQERFNRENISLHAGIEPDVHVEADPGRLGEVLSNLLENAMKYTPTGGDVRIELARNGTEVVLSVSDSGVGFDPDEAERLFDRFYRSNSGVVQEQPGSGLGLAIVKSIIETFGGYVRAFSEGIGRGSRFEVRLPAAGR